MIDLLDLFHYLVGLIIIFSIIWIFIKIHNYFSKDNISFEGYTNINKNKNNNNLI